MLEFLPWWGLALVGWLALSFLVSQFSSRMLRRARHNLDLEREVRISVRMDVDGSKVKESLNHMGQEFDRINRGH